MFLMLTLSQVYKILSCIHTRKNMNFDTILIVHPTFTRILAELRNRMYVCMSLLIKESNYIMKIGI